MLTIISLLEKHPISLSPFITGCPPFDNFNFVCLIFPLWCWGLHPGPYASWAIRSSYSWSPTLFVSFEWSHILYTMLNHKHRLWFPVIQPVFIWMYILQLLHFSFVSVSLITNTTLHGWSHGKPALPLLPTVCFLHVPRLLIWWFKKKKKRSIFSVCFCPRWTNYVMFLVWTFLVPFFFDCLCSVLKLYCARHWGYRDG